MKGNGCNVGATSRNDIEAWPLCEELVACQTKCLGLKQDVAIQQQALQEALVKTASIAPKFCGRHWMLPSNVDWHERII